MSKAAGTGQQARFNELAYGMLLTLLVAIVAFVVWWFLKGTWLKFSALLWAFICSIALSNLLPKLSEDRFKAGVGFSSSQLLQFSIALLGLTVSPVVWLKMGSIGLLVVLTNLVLAFLVGVLFCKYVMKMDDTLAILIGMGTSVCGASAVAAVGPALKAKGEQMGLAVGVVTLFGLIAMFSYPVFYNGPLAGWFGYNPLAYAMWAGTGIHETAQVVAAASQVTGALSLALSAKSVRILMIGPMVLFSTLLARRLSEKTGAERIKVAIPWFAVAFVIFTFVNLGVESSPVGGWWSSFDSSYLSPTITFLLAWAFAGVGLKVKISSIASIGLRAFLGGMVVAAAAGGAALLLVKFLWMPFSG